MKLFLLLITLVWSSVVKSIPYIPSKDSILLDDPNSDAFQSKTNISQSLAYEERAPPIPMDLKNFNVMFSLQNTEKAWPENYANMARYGLVEALQVLYVGLAEMQKYTSTTGLPVSFKRYFPATFEKYLHVQQIVSRLANQLSGARADRSGCTVPDPAQLPLKVYYQWGPVGMEEEHRKKCDEDRGPVAFMTNSPYDNKPATELNILIICETYFIGRQILQTEYPAYRERQSLEAKHLDLYASFYGREVRNAGIGGMGHAGTQLLHELLHWRVLAPVIGKNGKGEKLNRLIDAVFVSRKGNTFINYGPYAAQELNRVSPAETTTSVENYVWFLMEMVWRREKPAGFEFEDAPPGRDGGRDQDNPTDYARYMIDDPY